MDLIQRKLGLIDARLARRGRLHEYLITICPLLFLIVGLSAGIFLQNFLSMPILPWLILLGVFAITAVVSATDLDGDGQKELIAGATNELDTSTNLWPLFLNSTGGVDSHPATPIFGIADIGIEIYSGWRSGKIEELPTTIL